MYEKYVVKLFSYQHFFIVMAFILWS